ncbi:receptor-like protein EIX1 [Silene latifolia]|uniref:receptor-like protein EIX1 n=1 Tax=Silene latifolia TaxID=37657 RepID=UPI003D78516A
MRNIVKTCLLIYTFIFFNTTRCCSCKAGNSPNNSALRCKPSERAALLNFKHNLTFFDEDVLSAWKGEECCKWRGVVCDNTTGHIFELHLNGDDTNHVLKMEKLEYLLELKQLQSLDLSRNNFSYRSVPRFMGFMKQLMHLNLNSASLGGSIPYELDQDLDTSGVSEVIQGIERAYTSTLPYLVDIDLSCNNLVGSIPNDVTKMSSLLSLNLSHNQLSGTIPNNIGGLRSLISLDLSKNKLRGSIPTSMGELYCLSHLDLSYNNLSGPIPTGN